MNSKIRDVTVVVVAHNEARKIHACLSSLVIQSEKSPFQVIVIDNASDDDTSLLAEQSGASLGLRMKILRRSRNHLGAARAQGVQLATTPLVAFLDADCVAQINWLEDLLNQWAQLPTGYAAVGGPHRFREGPCAFSVARASLGKVWLAHLGAEQLHHRDSSDREHLPTANVLYLRSAVMAVGNFSDQFSRVGEDVHLSLRLRKAGLKLAWAESATVDHDQSVGWWQWAKRIFNYGLAQAAARGRCFWRWPLRLRFALSLMIAGLAFLLAMPGTVTVVVLALYFLIIVASCFAVVGAHPSRLLPLASLVSLTHFSYGLGLLSGLLSFPRSCQTEPSSIAEK